MAYAASGLICLSNTSIQSVWLLRTVDALGAADATGYITDASTAGSGKGAAGRGLKLGDIIFVQTVDSVTAPTSITAQSTGFVSAINATTGVGTVIFNVTTAP
jgi:hypothetical protein